MGRRYTVETYLRKLEPLAGFNLTADVIVGFPAEDERAFERTLATVRAAGLTKLHVFPYSPRPGTRTAAAGRRAAAGEEGAERAPALALGRGLPRALAGRSSAARTWCSSTGPGRGYGADYSPWLVEAPVGELVRVRAQAVTDEGILADAA